jgi:hypothetical protein
MPEAAARVASVSGAGWPYLLPSPDEMTATDGRSAARKAGVVDEVDP